MICVFSETFVRVQTALPLSFRSCWEVPTGGGAAAAAAATPASFGRSAMLAFQGGQHKRSNHTTSAGCALQGKGTSVAKCVK